MSITPSMPYFRFIKVSPGINQTIAPYDGVKCRYSCVKATIFFVQLTVEVVTNKQRQTQKLFY